MEGFLIIFNFVWIYGLGHSCSTMCIHTYRTNACTYTHIHMHTHMCLYMYIFMYIFVYEICLCVLKEKVTCKKKKKIFCFNGKKQNLKNAFK